MAVKIFIERRIKPDRLGDFLELSLQMRALAMRQPGYISGETLGSTDDDSIQLVISTWRSLKDWKGWEDNPERREIAEKMAGLLDAKSTKRAFTNLWGSGA